MNDDSRRRVVLAGLVVALVALLPLAPGLLSGHAFFFRDLATQYFPRRALAIEGLLAGELRYWNPYVLEGEPLSPALRYPLDLLQLLFHDARGLSWLLALHVSLGAVGVLCLGRALGLSTLAASGAGLVYALGGFMLSSLNLFVHLQAAAWAPFVVLCLRRAATGGPRAWAAAALVTAVALSTNGVEITGQAALFGIALGLSLQGAAGRLLRLGGALVLAVGLAAPQLAVLYQLAAQGARGAGLPNEMALAFSVHPVAVLQVVISGLFSSVPTMLLNFWGHRFFSGFPYFLSLYLGATVLALAVVGVLRGGAPARKVLALGGLGLVISLGPVAQLDLLLDAVPALRAFRFPSKALFLAHLAVALLAGWGLDGLIAPTRRFSWQLFAVASFLVGLPLAAARVAPVILPGTVDTLARAFFPPAYSPERRELALGYLLADASIGGLVCLAAAGVAALVLGGRLTARVGGLLALALIVADLVRAGIGLNPTLDAELLRPSPEARSVARTIRTAGGRLFTCEPPLSRGLGQLLNTSKARQDVLSLAALQESLSPYHNMPLRVPTAYSRDTSGFTSASQLFSDAERSCRGFPELVGRLRRAGVSHVMSVDAVAAPGAVLDRVLSPASLGGLQIGLYRLEDTLPLRQVARHVRSAHSAERAEALASTWGFQASGGAAVEGLTTETENANGQVIATTESTDRLAITVEADRDTVLVVRDTFAPGWRATVNGAPAPVLRADGRHRAVPIPRGRSRVVMRYRPPGLLLGCGVGILSAFVLSWLLWRGR